MYPRNAASPPRISIGAVVQISDGAVQTSDCTVRILSEGGAEGDGGGTTEYSTDGVVLYTPTQAETNYTAFVLIAKKTGCIPATITVVTTAGATAGIAVCADTQKVDVNTIATKSVTVDSGGTTFPASVGSSTLAAGAKMDLADSLNATGVADLKTKLGTIPASGNWLTTLGSAAPAGWINAASIAADSLTAIAGAIWAAATSGMTAVGSIGKKLADWVVGKVLTIDAIPQAALVAAIEVELANDSTGQAFLEAIAAKLNADFSLSGLTTATIGVAVRDAILNRVLVGNHDTADTAGKLLQNLDATITSRHASGAAVAKSPATLDWSADVSNKPTIPSAADNASAVASSLATAHGSGSWETATGFALASVWTSEMATAIGTTNTHVTHLATVIEVVP